MDQLPGAVGSSDSLALRVGQFIFSVASIAFMYMGIPFHGNTAFWFLMIVMTLVIVWSLIFALMDLCSVLFKVPIHLPAILAFAVLGDCVLSFLSLAASCSTASVVDYLMHSSCSVCEGNLCTRYQLFATMAFCAWFLTFASSLFNLLRYSKQKELLRSLSRSCRTGKAPFRWSSEIFTIDLNSY